MFRKLVFILVLASLTAGCGQSRPVAQGEAGSRGTATPFSEPTPQSTVTTSPAPFATGESPAAMASSQLRPDDATAFLARGNAYYAKGDCDKAIADYDQAIQLKPDFAMAYYNRGLAYIQQGRLRPGHRRLR